jgi:hypothetical protein
LKPGSFRAFCILGVSEFLLGVRALRIAQERINNVQNPFPVFLVELFSPQSLASDSAANVY